MTGNNIIVQRSNTLTGTEQNSDTEVCWNSGKQDSWIGLLVSVQFKWSVLQAE